MRYLLFFIFISIHVCNAQDDRVLRIVSYRGDVSIDNISIHSGQLVLSSSQKLVVAKNSYVYVLTPKGYSMKLETGSYKLEGIENMIYQKKYSARSTATGVVLRPAGYPLKFVGFDEWSSLFLMNDSTYLRWKKRNSSVTLQPPYYFRIFSLFEDPIKEIITNENFVRLNLREIAGAETHVLIRIEQSQLRRISFIPTEESTQISKDLSGIATDLTHKSILDLVIYDSNNLSLDLMFFLEKLAILDTTSLPTDLKNYVSLLKTKYEM